MDILRHGPLLTARLFKQDVVECIRDKAKGKVEKLVGIKLDKNLWWELINKFMQGRAQPLQKSILLRVMSGALVTRAKLRQWGYPTDGFSPACGVLDTVEHRLGGTACWGKAPASPSRPRRSRTCGPWT